VAVEVIADARVRVVDVGLRSSGDAEHATRMLEGVFDKGLDVNTVDWLDQVQSPQLEGCMGDLVVTQIR
jgi:hypothetical protein